MTPHVQSEKYFTGEAQGMRVGPGEDAGLAGGGPRLADRPARRSRRVEFAPGRGVKKEVTSQPACQCEPPKAFAKRSRQPHRPCDSRRGIG